VRRVLRSKPMKEVLYRESRLARILGDPAKYVIVNVLLNEGPLTVNEIVRRVSRSQPTVSHHLARLRSAELVRYEVKSDGSYYWIKYSREVKEVVEALNKFVNRTLHRVHADD